jgi:hypothetical protein
MVAVPFLMVSVAYMVESHSFGDLDIRSVGMAVKPLAVRTDVEIAAREPVLAFIFRSCSAFVIGMAEASALTFDCRVANPLSRP